MLKAGVGWLGWVGYETRTPPATAQPLHLLVPRIPGVEQTVRSPVWETSKDPTAKTPRQRRGGTAVPQGDTASSFWGRRPSRVRRDRRLSLACA